MKKIIIIIATLFILILLYNYVGIVRNLIAKALLPNSYKEYSFLSDNKIESKKYQVKKIIDGTIDPDILYNKATQEFLVKESMIGENTKHILWKISKDGKVIDSLTTNNFASSLGIYFKEDYYIDWINSGNKSKQKYKQIINIDSITDNNYKHYLEKAEVINYKKDVSSLIEDNLKVRCYLKVNNDWIVLESKKGYKLEPENFFSFKAKNNKSSMFSLTDLIQPFQKWRDADSFIHLQKFIGESRSSKSFYDINNTSKSGWHGIGYFKLRYNSNLFYFKSYTFKSSTFGFNPSISIYNPSINHIDGTKNNDLTFISLSRKGRSKRDYKEVGLYVICKK